MPTLLLMNRSSHVIGKISRYDNWHISLVANGLDEIVFDVHKYADGVPCPVWDDLVDLKIVEVEGFGKFEISVGYADRAETVKSVHGFSLEAELAQIILHDFHVNDDEATDMEYTEYSKDNYDKDGNYIPTTFYREILPGDSPEIADYKRKHSLLHRVLADKAPHWHIGYVTPYIALGEDVQPEDSSKFQRTYTVDGTSIYDFLTGTVAEESNVAFVFNTADREINCYSLCDCINQGDGTVMTGADGRKATGIGEDTFVFVSKDRLANETSITSNKDKVKNCFRIEGGDDVINAMVAAVNMGGNNYIYQFADFQYNDMSKALRDKIQAYQKMMASEETQKTYYGEDGIYTRLCRAYDDLGHYESSMMPNTDKVTEPGAAEEQYHKVVDALTANGFHIAVSSMDSYSGEFHVGVTNNIEAYAKVFLDSRFDLEVVKDTTAYSYVKNETTGRKNGTWTGKIKITQHTDKKNAWPIDISSAQELTVKVNDNEQEFARQKIHKALSEGSMAGIDFDMEGIWGDETLTDEEKSQKIRDYFNQYSLNRLDSFVKGYDSCISILSTLGLTATSETKETIYATYSKRKSIAESVRDQRQQQVDNIREQIKEIQTEQETFIHGGKYRNSMGVEKEYGPHDFRAYLASDDLYREFCSYRREDTYTNSNYTSEGLSDSECMEKARELVEVATKEARKACVLQRMVTTSLNNLFALPEFEPLYESFAMYNYIRVKTDDEILKLRLIGMEFMGESPEKIEVTFSEQIISVEGRISDLQSVIKQARAMATSYPSTTLQARQGADAKNEVTSMYEDGLNAAKTMLTNNDSNEVTIEQSGIICKRMDDEGYYGDKQLRITGNIMAFTDDNWQSVKMAIGETIFKDPKNNDRHGYGIVAENIVGKYTVSESSYIGNQEGNVLITSDGITIENGLIRSANYEEDEKGNGISGSMLDLTDGKFSFADGGLSYNNKKLVVKGNIGADSGTIGGWKIEKNKLSCSNTSGGQISLDSNTGTIFSVSSSREKKAVLTSGYLSLYSAEDIMCMMHGAKWADTEINGAGIYCHENSKFLVLGHDDNSMEGKYQADIIINNGLNLDGKTSPVQILTSSCFRNEAHFENNTYFENGICFGDDRYRISVDHINKTIDFSNHSYFYQDITCNGNISCFNKIDGNIIESSAVRVGTESCRPLVDGDASCGMSSYRWSSVYAKNGQIQTSDKNSKHNIKRFDERYENFFFKQQPIIYKFLNGDRVHSGFISQDIEESLNECGLTEMDFAGFCKDVKTTQEIDENGKEISVPVLDNNGNEVYTYSLRYSEFIALNTHMLQKAYAKIDTLEKEIAKLKKKLG